MTDAEYVDATEKDNLATVFPDARTIRLCAIIRRQEAERIADVSEAYRKGYDKGSTDEYNSEQKSWASEGLADYLAAKGLKP